MLNRSHVQDTVKSHPVKNTLLFGLLSFAASKISGRQLKALDIRAF